MAASLVFIFNSLRKEDANALHTLTGTHAIRSGV
jgi:hypothetical protein